MAQFKQLDGLKMEFSQLRVAKITVVRSSLCPRSELSDPSPGSLCLTRLRETSLQGKKYKPPTYSLEDESCVHADLLHHECRACARPWSWPEGEKTQNP